MNRHFDLSECPHPFAFALAHSLAHRVPAEDFGRAVAATVGHLLPNGQLFLAVPSDLTEHLAVLTRVAVTIDVTVEPVDRAGHPRGEPVYRVVRKTR